MRLAVWLDFDKDRHGFECSQCLNNPKTLESRGFCGGALTRESGADYDRKRQAYCIEAGLAVSSGAEHLPSLFSCPVAFVNQYRPQINKIFKEYKVLKRLGIRDDITIRASDLLCVDDEILRLQEKENKKRQAIEEAKRKASKNG